MTDSEQRYRLVVLGSGRVGKSSIIRRLLKDEFVEGYKATVEDLHCRDYDIDGTTIKVDILDTAGNLEFPADVRRSADDLRSNILTTVPRDEFSVQPRSPGRNLVSNHGSRGRNSVSSQTDHWLLKNRNGIAGREWPKIGPEQPRVPCDATTVHYGSFQTNKDSRHPGNSLQFQQTSNEMALRTDRIIHSTLEFPAMRLQFVVHQSCGSFGRSSR